MSYVRSKRHPELFRPAGSSVWWAFLPRTGPGRMPRESTGQRDEVAAHRWYIERVRSDAGGASRALPSTSLEKALARRAEERTSAGRAAGTISCLTVKGKQLCRVLGGDTPLAAIDARAVDRYIATRLRGDENHDPVSRVTIYKELVTLRGALKLARRQGYDAPTPEAVMPLDFSPKYKPRERALSEREIRKLLKALVRPERRAVVAFILATGATYPSEVAPVRKTDIDLETGRVRLRGTKRATRDRVVPVVRFAREWLALAAPYAPFAPWANIRRDLHAACDEAGIGRCSPNDLRRTVATLMRARGVEPSLIGCYLGHADSRMVERVYGRLPVDALEGLLSARLGGGKKGARRRAA